MVTFMVKSREDIVFDGFEPGVVLPGIVRVLTVNKYYPDNSKVFSR